MDSNILTIGSRASVLAMVQSEHVASLLRSAHPHLTVKIEARVSSGDKILDKPLSEISEGATGGGGLFTTELETGLLSGEFDLAVHSLKDMPTTLPEKLILAGITEREDCRDALVVASRHKGIMSLSSLPDGSMIGSSSLRRKAFLAKHNPTIGCKSIRGNLQTRMKKLEDESLGYDAIILAVAGLKRLGWEDKIACVLDEDKFPWSVGQGSLGIEIREEDSRVNELIKCLIDVESDLRCRCERTMLNTLQGGCQVPIGVHTVIKGTILHLRGEVISLDGKEHYVISDSCDITGGNVNSCIELGKEVGKKLIALGAQSVLGDLKEKRAITYGSAQGKR